MPLLQKPGSSSSYGVIVGDIVVVDKQGIVRGVYTEQDIKGVNAMLNVVIAGTPLAVWGPKTLYFGLKLKTGDLRVNPITIENQGASDLKVTDIKSTVEGLTLDQTSLTIPPNAKGVVRATLIPVHEGTLSGKVTFSTDDPANRSVELIVETLQVEKGAAPAIGVAETALSLGTVEPGRPATATITVRNDGQGSLSVTRLETDLSGATFSDSSFTVVAGGSKAVTVTVTPSAEGAFTGVVRVLSNDPTKATVTVPLSGTAAVVKAEARIDFNGSGTVDFGDFVQFAAAFGSDQVKFDLNGSGAVDFGDFVVFAANFGRSVN